MVESTNVFWSCRESNEQIILEDGEYKLLSVTQMIPLGKSIEELKQSLEFMKRTDILKSLC